MCNVSEKSTFLVVNRDDFGGCYHSITRFILTDISLYTRFLLSPGSGKEVPFSLPQVSLPHLCSGSASCPLPPISLGPIPVSHHPSLFWTFKCPLSADFFLVYKHNSISPIFKQNRKTNFLFQISQSLSPFPEKEVCTSHFYFVSSVCVALTLWPDKLEDPMVIFHRCWLVTPVKTEIISSSFNHYPSCFCLWHKVESVFSKGSLNLLFHSSICHRTGRDHLLSTLQFIWAWASSLFLSQWWIYHSPIAPVNRRLGNILDPIFVQGC